MALVLHRIDISRCKDFPFQSAARAEPLVQLSSRPWWRVLTTPRATAPDDGQAMAHRSGMTRGVDWVKRHPEQ